MAAAAGVVAGCARKVQPFSAKQAVEALEEQSSKIRSVRGRAWISARTPEGKISFPAVIALDRGQPPRARLEAIDLVGTTHVLMVLDASSRFTWVDFDRGETTRMSGSWHGLPLGKLPDLLTGTATFPVNATIGSVKDDAFDVRTLSYSIRYLMTWIDPGPRLALNGVDGEVPGRRERYVVTYSKFADTPDFYLPTVISVKGFQGGRSDPAMELEISWRERRWNENIPAEVFNAATERKD